MQQVSQDSGELPRHEAAQWKKKDHPPYPKIQDHVDKNFQQPLAQQFQDLPSILSINKVSQLCKQSLTCTSGQHYLWSFLHTHTHNKPVVFQIMTTNQAIQVLKSLVFQAMLLRMGLMSAKVAYPRGPGLLNLPDCKKGQYTFPPLN